MISMQQTKRVQRIVPVNSPKSWGQIPTPTPSFVNYIPGPFSIPTPIPQVVQQQQQTLTKSADFPELYIGPPRRGRGRPEGSTTSKLRTKSKREPGSSSSRQHDIQTPGIHEATAEPRAKGKEQTKPRSSRPQPQPTKPPFICAPLTRQLSAPSTSQVQHGVPQTQPLTQSSPQSEPFSQPNCQNPAQNTLLTLLTAVTSNSTPVSTTANLSADNTVLLTALTQLLTANPQLLQPTLTACETSTSSLKQRDFDVMDDGDSDIVILDSSTVDTAAFRKEGAGSATTSCPRVQGLDTSSTQNTSPSPMPASTPPSSQDTPLSSSLTPEIAPPHSLIPESQTSTPTRVPSKRCEDACLPYNSRHSPTSPTPTRLGKRSRNDNGHVQVPSIPSVRKVPGPTSETSASRHKSIGPFPPERLPCMMSTIRKSSTSPLYSSNSRSRTIGEGTTKLCSSSGCATSLPSPTVVPSREAGKSTTLRKRTLEEFMAEHEARGRNKSKRRMSSRRDAGRQHRTIFDIHHSGNLLVPFNQKICALG